MMTDVWARAGELSKLRKDFVIVTLLATRGHAPQDPGAKMIVTREGLDAGTVGGGKIEARCIEHAREFLSKDGVLTRTHAPQTVTWNLQRDIGMSCGGEVTVLFETIRQKEWSVTVFGAGHVAQALVRLLDTLNCQIAVLDPRAEWIDKLPSSPRLHARTVENLAAQVELLSPQEFCVVMTQGHATDLPILKALYARADVFPYVGVIGSDVKALKIRSELKEAGATPEQISKLHSPMGLPLGSNDPAEIAISIAAELIQVRDQLRARPGSSPA